MILGISISTAMGQSPLGLGEDKALDITFMGKPLLRQEHLTLADFAQGQFEALNAPAGWQRVTRLQSGPSEPVSYYRETALRPGRVEITWYVKYPSVDYGALKDQKAPGSFEYSVNIPAHWLAGAKYKAAVTTGKIGAAWRTRAGTIPPAGDQLILSKFQAVTFTTPNGKTFTINLNPRGPQNTIPYFQMENSWTLSRQGDHYQLKAAFPRPTYGDRREFKIVIHEGPRDTSGDQVGVRTNNVALRPRLELAFTSVRPPKRYQAVGTQTWQSGQPYGWLDNRGLSLQDDAAPALWAHAIQPAQPAKKEFVLQANDGELNLIHIAFGSASKPIGPFNVYVNGELKLKKLSAQPGQLQAKTTYGWAKNGQIKLTFEGNWRLNGIGLTPLLEKNQDYLFSRTWWADQKQFEQWEDRIEPTPPLADVSFPSEPATRRQRMAWTWNTPIESLAGSINGSRRADLEMPEAVERRIAQFKSNGYGAFMIGGLHFSFNFIGSKADAIALRNERLAVETAHRHGLKALRHFDLNWILYPGIPDMLKLLDQDPDFLARSLIDPFVVQANPCLNSPVFQKLVADYLSNEIRKTGLDGYQLDEFVFYRNTTNGCDRCRAMFKEQTGLTLPRGNEGKWFDDRTNATWRAYLRWQGRAERAVVEQLLKKLRRVNPNLLWSRYTSLALSHPAATKIDLADGFPYGCDYLGDEFHPNDILTNWRTAFIRFKSRQGAVASYGNFPTWYLPKIAQDNSQYLYAWAVARMNRGNFWRRSVDDKLSHTLNTWKWQMDDQHARPIADVAVLLSRPTVFVSDDRQFFHEEYGGWLQTLATENIQYNVILDRDIDLGRLKDYKVLILPNAAAMDDKTVMAIEQFAETGGQVIASYETGRFDASGAPRKTPALEAAMNLKPGQLLEKGGDVRFAAPLSNGMARPELKTKAPLIAHPLIRPDASQIWAEITADGKPLAPAVVATPHGKGRFIYIAGNLISQNYEPRMATTAINKRVAIASRGTDYKTDLNPDLNRMVANLLHTVAKGQFRTEAMKIPDGVIYTAFEQQSDKGRALVLHFLNVQGKPHLKLGQPVTLQAPIPQPPLPFDIDMRLRADFDLNSAFLVAPFKEGRTPLTLQRRADGSYRLRIPKEAITNYAVVYLEP
jgi:hypothetical protein